MGTTEAERQRILNQDAADRAGMPAVKMASVRHEGHATVFTYADGATATFEYLGKDGFRWTMQRMARWASSVA
jgi:hypothetical protein